MNEIREQRRTKIPGQILQGFSASKNGFEAFFGGPTQSVQSCYS